MYEFAIGIGLAVLFVFMLEQKILGNPRRLLGIVLVIIAALYPAFSLLAGNVGSVFEWLGVVLFLIFAWLSIARSIWFLAIGWFLHAGWDLLFHYGMAAGSVPPWYPLFCASFDFIVAAYILMRRRDWALLQPNPTVQP